jgi:TRAP-type C4-dicarboxylate transport system substrate-binding protein
MKKGVLAVVFILVGLIAIGTVFSGGQSDTGGQDMSTSEPEPATVEPLEIRLVAWSSLPGIKESQQRMIWELIENIEEASEGKITFNFLGGGEIIGIFDQGDALAAGGVCDALMTAGSFVAKTDPDLLTIALSERNIKEKRESGYWDMINDAIAESNIFYLTDCDASGFDNWNTIWLNEPIESLEDLDGLRMIVTPSQGPAVTNYGATTLSMGPADYYTAMERGLADGYVYPMEEAWFIRSLDEVTKYVVTPGFSSTTASLFFNLDFWNNMSEAQRSLIMRVTEETEEEWIPKWTEIYENVYLKKILSSGIEQIELSEEEHAEMERLYYDAQWADIIEQSPVWGPKLRALAGT